MLLSEAIKKVIIKEKKALESLIKALENQEKNYGADYTADKERIGKSLEYYNKIIEDAN